MEKSKLEKKVAVMESLKIAHYREVSRSKFNLENLLHEKGLTIQTLQQLRADEAAYKSRLRYDKEGAKENPIQLNGISTADAEAIGKQLIRLYQSWRPKEEPKIGSLYGFDLFIRQQKETIEEEGKLGYRTYNTLYAERPGSGIRYTYNNGHPNTDNPKLAARYFLNAIDRVSSLAERYGKTLEELERNIPMVQAIASKPFEKEAELAQMKSELSKLEREIAIKIQENQMKQAGTYNNVQSQVTNMAAEPAAAYHAVKDQTRTLAIIAKARGPTVNSGYRSSPQTNNSNVTPVLKKVRSRKFKL